MKRSGVYLLVGLLLILFGGTSLLVAENQKGRSSVLATDGVQAQGTIKQKRFLKNGGRGATTYTLVIVNHGADDAEVTMDVVKERYDEFEEGQDVDLVYLPSDPQVFDFGTVDHEKVLLHRTQVMEILSPLCLLAGLVLFGFGFKAGLKEPFR